MNRSYGLKITSIYQVIKLRLICLKDTEIIQAINIAEKLDQNCMKISVAMLKSLKKCIRLLKVLNQA